MMPDDSWKPRGRADLVFRKVGDDWLLFDPVAEKIHVLNLSAALVWSYCTGEHRVDEIRAAVADAFGEGEDAPAGHDPVGESVTEILERLRAAGLFEEDDDG